VLLIHGDDDRNVPFQQTTDLVEKLRAQNVGFEELIIPDEIHDLLRWSRLGPRLPRHRRILRPQIGFLRQTAISPPASLPEYFAVM
jgi:dipeptidyl aminopeptidase/acylaminoacyl peptidase